MSSKAAPKRNRVDPVNAGLKIWAILVYAFLFLPIVIIVIYSFNSGRALESWSSFGTNWYRSLVDNPVIRKSVITSLKVAVGATIISTILGSLAGIALARRPGRWVIFFMGLVFLVLVTPEIVDAISLLIWYVRIKGPFGPGFSDIIDSDFINYGLMRLWVGHALFSTAVVTLIVRARLAGFDESLEEAAADLYAPPGRRFRQITLAADDARGARGCLARVQPLARQHDHLDLRCGRRLLAVARLRLQRAACGAPTRSRRDLDHHAVAHVVRARRRRHRAETQW